MHLNPLPANQQQLILFAADLSQTIAYTSMRTYLSAVRHLHISEGHEDPLRGSMQLDLLMRGARRTKPTCKDYRLPITPLILSRIYEVSGQLVASGFFAFLHSGEFTLKQGECIDPSWHLLVNDVATDNLSKPTRLQIHIKGSKTDQWRQGTYLVLGHTNSHICPAKAVLAYIAVREFKEGPLFIDRKGSPFTQQALISSLQTTLTKAGIDCTHYSGHSFHIGAATTASAKGVPEATYKHSGDGVVTCINGTFGYLIANWPAFHPSSFKSDSRLEVATGQLLVGIM